MKIINKNGTRFAIIKNGNKFSVEENIGGAAWISRYFADTENECEEWINNK